MFRKCQPTTCLRETDEIKNDVSACSTSTTRIASRGSQDAFAPKKPLMSFVPSAAAADAARRIRARRSLVARRWHPSQSVRKFSRPHSPPPSGDGHDVVRLPQVPGPRRARDGRRARGGEAEGPAGAGPARALQRARALGNARLGEQPASSASQSSPHDWHTPRSSLKSSARANPARVLTRNAFAHGSPQNGWPSVSRRDASYASPHTRHSGVAGVPGGIPGRNPLRPLRARRARPSRERRVGGAFAIPARSLRLRPRPRPGNRDRRASTRGRPNRPSEPRALSSPFPSAAPPARNRLRAEPGTAPSTRTARCSSPAPPPPSPPAPAPPRAARGAGGSPEPRATWPSRRPTLGGTRGTPREPPAAGEARGACRRRRRRPRRGTRPP
jgi:hypothetical protein